MAQSTEKVCIFDKFPQNAQICILADFAGKILGHLAQETGGPLPSCPHIEPSMEPLKGDPTHPLPSITNVVAHTHTHARDVHAFVCREGGVWAALYINILGSDQPPTPLALSSKVIGPIVAPEPAVLDFGKITVLEEVAKRLPQQTQTYSASPTNRALGRWNGSCHQGLTEGGCKGKGKEGGYCGRRLEIERSISNLLERF